MISKTESSIKAYDSCTWLMIHINAWNSIASEIVEPDESAIHKLLS